MTYFKINGFSPDLETTTEGILKNTDGYLPTERGLEAFPGPSNTQLATATATVIGAASIVKLGGSSRTFIGTPTEIQEAGTTTWTDVSRTGGYTNTATRFRFEQFADETLATNDTETLQGSVTGAFADITGSVQCKTILVGQRQAIALNTVDGTFGDSPDRWRTSAQDDVHDWTPSIATLAGSGRLVDTPGEITAGKFLHDDLIVFKDTSMLRGRFVGAPEIWQFVVIEDTIGSPSQESVIHAGEADLFFMSNNDFYFYNGAQLQSVGEPIREWFFTTQLSQTDRTKVVGVHDVRKTRILWWYPSSSGGGALDRYVAYHYRQPKWTTGALTIQYIFELLLSSAPTYDTLGNAYATYDDLPQVAYDSNFWTDAQEFIGLFDTSQKLQTISGIGRDAELTLWDIGQDGQKTFISRVRPRFQSIPTSAKLVRATADQLASTPSGSSTSVMSRGKFDNEKEARWFQHRFISEGTTEIVGFDIEGQQGGEE